MCHRAGLPVVEVYISKTLQSLHSAYL
jgi:hypothetical protein